MSLNFCLHCLVPHQVSSESLFEVLCQACNLLSSILQGGFHSKIISDMSIPKMLVECAVLSLVTGRYFSVVPLQPLWLLAITMGLRLLPARMRQIHCPLCVICPTVCMWVLPASAGHVNTGHSWGLRCVQHKVPVGGVKHLSVS